MVFKNNDSNARSLPERHERILELLHSKGSVSVTALSEMLKVSEVTIRKDLSSLEEQNKLYRAHGSAILISPYITDRHVNEKEKHNVAEKRGIGMLAASLIGKDDSILIASGTTMLFFAREITPIGKLTVITSAVQVTSILSQNRDIEVVQLGGVVRNSSVSVVGYFAEEMLRSFTCSKLYMGVDGLDMDFGLTTSNMMEAKLNRSMMNASQRTIVLTDSSKFGRRGFSRICGIEDVNQIITDGGIPPCFLSELRERGVEVTVIET